MNNILKSIKSLVFNSNFFIFLVSFTAVATIALWYSTQQTQLSSTAENLGTEKKPNTSNSQNDNMNQISPESMKEEKVDHQESSHQETIENSENYSAIIQNSPQNQKDVNSLLLKNTRYGHFQFAEVPRERLMNMGKYYHRTEYLDKEAGIAFQRMKHDAQSQGVKLVLISGFRSIASQRELFTKQIQRRGSERAAAKLSAPPGHSEHHTGYAIDIGDGTKPQFDLKYDFEYTQAYQWLNAKAGNYGFELSFPRNNPQGVSFEPWHWRYIGSERASGIFAQTRSLQ